MSSQAVSVIKVSMWQVVSSLIYHTLLNLYIPLSFQSCKLKQCLKLKWCCPISLNEAELWTCLNDAEVMPRLNQAEVIASPVSWSQMSCRIVERLFSCGNEIMTWYVLLLFHYYHFSVAFILVLGVVQVIGRERRLLLLK